MWNPSTGRNCKQDQTGPSRSLHFQWYSMAQTLHFLLFQMLHAPVSWFGCGYLQHSGPIGTDWVKDTGHFGGVRYTLANNLWWVLNRKWFRVMLSVGSSNNTLMPPSFFGIFLFVRQLSISFSERAYQLGQVGPTWAIQGYHITQPKMDYTHPKK